MRRLAGSALFRSPGFAPKLSVARREALHCRTAVLATKEASSITVTQPDGFGAVASPSAAQHLAHDGAGPPKNASGGCILGIDPDTNGAFAVMRWGQHAQGDAAAQVALDATKTCSHTEPGLEIFIADTPTMEVRTPPSARFLPCHDARVAASRAHA